MILLVVVVMLVVAFGFTMMSGARMGSGMMGGWGMGRGMIGSGLAWPLMFLVPGGFVVLMILGLYYLFSGQGSSRHEESEALRILKERYARGEITSEQYTKMKQDLSS